MRYSTNEELSRGEKFCVIDLNGAALEATNVYDYRNPLLSAYRTLYRHWKLVYAIGYANRKAGYKTTSVLSVLHDVLECRSISAAYPAAD